MQYMCGRSYFFNRKFSLFFIPVISLRFIKNWNIGARTKRMKAVGQTTSKRTQFKFYLCLKINGFVCLLPAVKYCSPLKDIKFHFFL